MPRSRRAVTDVCNWNPRYGIPDEMLVPLVPRSVLEQIPDLDPDLAVILRVDRVDHEDAVLLVPELDLKDWKTVLELEVLRERFP